MSRSKVLRGVVRGNVIELDEDAGISDGEHVALTVRRIASHSRRAGEGFLRTEGVLADDFEWDIIMEEIQQSRKQERRRNEAR